MNKTLIALSAAALFGSVSAALAYEAPENKIGDRYPVLEQTYAPTAVRPLVVLRCRGPDAPSGLKSPRTRSATVTQLLATVYQPVARPEWLFGPMSA